MLLPIVPVALLYAAVFFFALLTVVRRLLFDDGRVVWTDSGRLIVVDERNFAVNLADIVEIFAGRVGQYSRAGVSLKLKDGSKKVILTTAFRERPEEIAEKIKSCVSSWPREPAIPQERLMMRAKHRHEQQAETNKNADGDVRAPTPSLLGRVLSGKLMRVLKAPAAE